MSYFHQKSRDSSQNTKKMYKRAIAENGQIENENIRGQCLGSEFSYTRRKPVWA